MAAKFKGAIQSHGNGGKAVETDKEILRRAFRNLMFIPKSIQTVETNYHFMVWKDILLHVNKYSAYENVEAV